MRAAAEGPLNCRPDEEILILYFVKAMKRFSARISANRPVKGGFHEMEFSWDPAARLPLPGQFFTLRISPDNVPLLRRPFAFSSFDEDAMSAAMLYRPRGRGTEILTAKKAGDAIDVLGPLGTFFRPPQTGLRALLVAGGIGIGPVLFLASSLRGRGIAATPVFGFRSAEHVPAAAISKLPGAAVCTDDGSAGFKGTAVDYLKSIEKDISPGSVLYACGPAAMLKACHEFASGRGCACAVSVEQVMACGVGACMGCAVKAAGGGYVRACTEGPVFISKDLQWD